MFEHLPGDRRHAAEMGDAFFFHQRQRLVDIPAALHDDLMPAQHRRDHDRKAAGGVKERHRDQERFLRRVRIGRGRRFAAAQEGARLRRRAVQHVGDDVAVRDHRALGISGRARGVEDGDIVVGRAVRQFGRPG